MITGNMTLAEICKLPLLHDLSPYFITKMDLSKEDHYSLSLDEFYEIAVEKNFVILRMIMSAHTFNNCHLGQYGEYVSYTEGHKKTTWRHNENGAYAGTGNH